MANKMTPYEQMMAALERAKKKDSAPRMDNGDQEHDLQCACVKDFRSDYPALEKLLFAVPNGGFRNKTTAGKMKAEDLHNFLTSFEKDANNAHMVEPGMVYISYPTEYGTLYTKEELKDIYNTAKANDLYVFIDGARLAVGLTSKYTDVEPSDISKYSDLFYIGGTKNGFLVGEALVINDKKLAEEFRYEIKNKGALLAKGFLNGIEFERAFQDNLYFDIAKTAIEKHGYNVTHTPIRGGTDGARLSFMGVPCPNICTGGMNFHGRFEYAVLDDMELITRLLVEIAKGN